MPMPFHSIELFILFGSIFWAWMLIDCLLNRKLDPIQKVLALLFILFAHVIGALAYFFIKVILKHYQTREIYYATAHPDFYQQYQQGYRVQREVLFYQPEKQEQQSEYMEYEQPRASYPEQRQ